MPECQNASSDTMSLHFGQKSLVRDFIECFCEVEIKDINRVAFINELCKSFQVFQKIGEAGLSSHESML